MRLTLHCFHRQSLVCASASGDSRPHEAKTGAKRAAADGASRKTGIGERGDFLGDKHALGRVRHSPAEIHHLRSLAGAAVQSLADKREK